MGCVSSDLDAGIDTCTSRDSSAFIAPNCEHVTYKFDYLSKESQISNLSDGICLHGDLVSQTTEYGYLIEPQRTPDGIPPRQAGRLAPKWYTMKENVSQPIQLRVGVSGRVFIRVPEGVYSQMDPGVESCVFAVSTRGAMHTISVQTQQSRHTTHNPVVNSSIIFAVFIVKSAGGFSIMSRILLSLECGDDVPIVHDCLGPMPPSSFYLDFCIVDEGCRNVQLDMICKGANTSPYDDPHSASTDKLQTVRMCLQDYTTFNSHLKSSYISIGNSSLGTNIPSASVYLQNLVISEEDFVEVIPELEPVNVDDVVSREIGSAVMFVGEDARTVAKAGCNLSLHPQLDVKRNGYHRTAAIPDLVGNEFWYHVKYDDVDGGSTMSEYTNHGHYRKVMTGEFWLSKEKVDKKNVYFHISSTMGQALTMCIAFRFNCPFVHLNLIKEGVKGARVLRHEVIPTNAIILGVEHDPRNQNLLRMFVEHRNEIIDDMIVCEARSGDLAQSIVHQEVYDGGHEIHYRISLFHPDGTRQSAVLQTSLDRFPFIPDSGRGVYDCTVYEPSPRFPITPCTTRHHASMDNRIFVYTTVTCQQDEVNTSDRSAGLDDFSEDATSMIRSCVESELGVEDWLSAQGGLSDREQGGLSDGEPDEQRHNREDAPDNSSNSLGIRGEARSPRDRRDCVPFEVEWRRPIVQSATLICRVEDPPFKCFPKSLS